MKYLIVLVGVQGAGKSTILANCSSGIVLKPSTTRPKRNDTDNEYYFEQTLDNNSFAWIITRGSYKYGMLISELDKIQSLGITVFDPKSLSLLKDYPAVKKFEIVTIGLDTVSTIEAPHQRVNHDDSRKMLTEEFETERNVVQSCDVVLKGDLNIVNAALQEIALILTGRGGVLSGSSIKKLISAGTLLENAVVNQIESASYDLRLSDQYWCQGQYHVLSPTSPVAEIPPYSFAFVQAHEIAILPKFIVANFDIRVSLFFSGVILSNGPQVDPGYRGALFCMLHNASGTPVGINRGEHFATIQFQTLAMTSSGYTSQYQNKRNFTNFLNGSSAKKPGGQIYEHINSISGHLESKYINFRNTHWTIMAVFLAVLAIEIPVLMWIMDKAVTTISEKAISENTAKVDMAIQRFNEIFDKIISETKIIKLKKSLDKP